MYAKAITGFRSADTKDIQGTFLPLENKMKAQLKAPQQKLQAILVKEQLELKTSTLSKSHQGYRKKVELNHPIYYKDALTSEWKQVKVLHWVHGFAYSPIGNEKLWIPSKLIKIRIEQERVPENPWPLTQKALISLKMSVNNFLLDSTSNG